VLTVADLEVNVLEFRQRAFQFERLVELEDTPYALFTRTETETESKFRPKLVRLVVVLPLGWVVYDEPADILRAAREGAAMAPRIAHPVVEVGAEPTEFREEGIEWRRISRPSGLLVYTPAGLTKRLSSPDAVAALGLA
jgi:hypothetical protein